MPHVMKSVRAVIRPECVADVVQRLERTGVPRLYVGHVHAHGAGVDPERFRLSLDEGESYNEKAVVEFLCAECDVDEVVSVVRETACTGHRGDGVVIIQPVDDVVSIRTGDHDGVALL